MGKKSEEGFGPIWAVSNDDDDDDDDDNLLHWLLSPSTIQLQPIDIYEVASTRWQQVNSQMI